MYLTYENFIEPINMINCDRWVNLIMDFEMPTYSHYHKIRKYDKGYDLTC